ncbi:hypothetical protein Pint_07468 [Pistacia integerrima]|uniref:Uncharacterized protein n=2 Tax=Pistacia TaxID=55512 RepID=A0ACC1AEH4_9ROSI|nr:hypothetical protein Pint_07468 [Pistacia integerrima]KAJ0085924.1 hypothetical protein Patl1_07576 [Pistacia atlantica]
MKIVSGRVPVDCSQPQAYLIDWLKSMVAKQKVSFIGDPICQKCLLRKK